MKINKIISFILTIIILLFSFCPLAFASNDDNLINPNMTNWNSEGVALFHSSKYYDDGENFNQIIFQPMSNADWGYYWMDTEIDNFVSGNDYQFSCDLRTYHMNYVTCEIGVVIDYGDVNENEFIILYQGGKSSTNPNYENIIVKFRPQIENRSYNCLLYVWFDKLEGGSVSISSNCSIKNLSLTEIESKEGNILKRIYNFIINLPSTFQNFFTDLKNGISGFFTDLKTNLSTWFNNLKTSIGGFFTDLKTNLSTWFDNLKTSIGDFFDNLSDNLSEFFTKLKNWLLWFNAEGSSSYTNPFEQIDDDVDDDLESSIVKLANYINDNTGTVSETLENVGSVFLVFDAFVVGIPLVLSLIVFAFFIHILKRLLGF